MPPHCAAAQQQDQIENTTWLLSLPSNSPRTDPKWKSLYDRRPVGQCFLVSSPVWGSWPDVNYGLTVTVLSISGAPSDERSGLSFRKGSILYRCCQVVDPERTPKKTPPLHSNSHIYRRCRCPQNGPQRNRPRCIATADRRLATRTQTRPASQIRFYIYRLLSHLSRKRIRCMQMKVVSFCLSIISLKLLTEFYRYLIWGGGGLCT
jgi:hypothetical protein